MDRFVSKKMNLPNCSTGVNTCATPGALVSHRAIKEIMIVSVLIGTSTPTLRMDSATRGSTANAQRA